MSQAPSPPRQQSFWNAKMITLVVMALVILGFSMWGFSLKLHELVNIFREQQGGFAVAPILNYLLASLGFFCILMWCVCNGVFSDLEGPKYFMLERERELDSQPRTAHSYRHEAAWEDAAPGEADTTHQKTVTSPS